MHCSDIGGRVPGSISPANTDIFQDGIRIPVIKLFRRGALNEDVLRLFMANCRIPDQNWGDIKALVAALNTAEKRVHELCGRYGPDAVQDGIDAGPRLRRGPGARPRSATSPTATTSSGTTSRARRAAGGRSG